MSLYYVLETEDYRGEVSCIGSIMEEVSETLLKNTGLKLSLYCGEINGNITDNNEPEIIHEELLYKNMCDTTKVEKILKYINDIRVEGEELIIIDPYLFVKPDGGYDKFLTSILKACKCKFKKISVFIKQNNTNQVFLKKVKEVIGDYFQEYYTDEFHDRFWIGDRKKGFIMGTSMNGIGKKYSIIQKLEESDVVEIINITGQISGNSLNNSKNVIS